MRRPDSWYRERSAADAQADLAAAAVTAHLAAADDARNYAQLFHEEWLIREERCRYCGRRTEGRASCAGCGAPR